MDGLQSGVFIFFPVGGDLCVVSPPPAPYPHSVVLLRSGCMYGMYMNATAWYGVVITYTFRAVGEIEEVCDGDGDVLLCIALPLPL